LAGWGLLHELVKQRFCVFFLSFFLFFSNSPTAQTERPTYAYYIPEDAVCAKGVPFWGYNTKNFVWGVIPPNPPLLGRE
jgi:hypothetical protein